MPRQLNTRRSDSSAPDNNPRPATAAGVQGGFDVRDVLPTGLPWHLPVVLSLLLVVISRHNYLLFHTLAELFAVTVAVMAGVAIWHTYPFSRNHYLMFLGSGYLWVAGLDLLHTLTYKGMGVYALDGANMASQFWVAARWFETLLFLGAIAFLRRPIRRRAVFPMLGLLAAGLCALIMFGGFPDAYVEGQGLTRFKVFSEYLIIASLGAAIGLMWRVRQRFDAKTLRLMTFSILFTMAAELTFTLYTDVYGAFNLLGHLFKLFSYWLIFHAIVQTSLIEPVRVLNRNLLERLEDRERAERSLATHEQRYRTLLDQAPTVLLSLDAEGRIDEFNQAAEALFEQPRDAVLGLDYVETFCPQEVWESVRLDIEKVLSGTPTKNFEYTVVSAGGRKHLVKWNLDRVADIRGNWNILCVGEDITERRQAEVLLEKTRESLQEAQKIAHLGSFEYVAATGKTVWSEEEYRIYGLDPAGPSPEYNDMLARCIHPQDATLLHEVFTRAMGEHGVYELEHRILRPDGEVRWVYDRAHPYFDGQGELLRYVGVTLDTTERKLAEQQLRRESSKNQALFLNGADGHHILDMDGNLVEANKAFLDLLGYSRADAIGMNVNQWDVHFDSAATAGIIQRHYVDGKRVQFETCHQRKDGSRYDAEIIGTPLVLDEQPLMFYSARDVTERVLAKRALSASEARYRRIVETAMEGIWVIDAQAVTSFVNPRMAAMLGYERDGMLGRSLFDFMDATAERHARALFDERKAGKAAIHEFRFRHRRGDDVWTRVSTTAVTDSEQGFDGAFAMVADISDLKATEFALRESERKYRLLFEQIPQGVVIQDENLRIADCNPAAVRILGRSREELLGLSSLASDWRCLHEDGREFPGETHPVARALRSGEPTETTVMGVFNPQTKAYVWISVDAVPLVTDEDGHPRGVFSSFTDITERKRIEVQLRQSQQLQRELFEAIETSFLAYDVVDATGRFVYANPAYLKLWGYGSGDEVIGTSPVSHCDDPNMPQRIITTVQARGGGDFEFKARRKDGTTFDCHMQVAIHRRSDGSEVYHGFSEDVTESRMLQQALIHSQKLEVVGRLTGGIAHDFNNILGSVLGFAELARLRNAAQDEKMAGYLEQIETAGLRARDLVRQLLIYSRGERTGEVTPMSVIPMVKETAKLLRSTLPAGIDMHLDLADGVPPIRIDVLHLQQMLMNLGINARDAMPDGGALTLSVRSTRCAGQPCLICRKPMEGDWVELAVNDTGRGIPGEQRDLLCQPFYTTKEVGEGSGMGLAVVEGLLRTYGGHLLLDSVPGDGARFRLLFPPVDQQGAPAGDVQLGDMPVRKIGGRRVLVAEDEPSIQVYYREILSLAGAEPTICSDGAQALETFMMEPAAFDLLLVDLGMPNVGGIEFLKRVRAVNARIPVIVCSGNDEAVKQDVIEQLRIDAVLLKPIQHDELTGCIERIMENGR